MGAAPSRSAPPPQPPLSELQAACVGYARRVAAAAPLVHCYSNFVAMDLMANALLAAGASPAMVHSPDEAADFTRLASALLVNMGTRSPAWEESMRHSIGAARARGTPWVLDPVGCGATPARTAVTCELARLGPAVIRGNASEVMALAAAVLGADGGGARPKGVDSAHGSSEAEPAARALAAALRTVVAVTGAVDFATDGATTVYAGNGTPLCTRVTAAGCALTAVLAAFLAARPPRPEGGEGAAADGDRSETVLAAAAAMAYFGLAAQWAHHTAAAAAAAAHPAQQRRPVVVVGPGTLRVGLLDALHALSSGGAWGECAAVHRGGARRLDSLLRLTADPAEAARWRREAAEARGDGGVW